jgi:LysM repeat protein
MKYLMTFFGVVALVLATGFTSLPATQLQAISDPQPAVVLSPSSGAPGSTVHISISGFPANTPVQIGLHKPGRKLLEVTKNTTTNSNGDVTVSMKIPTFKNEENNEQWLAKVYTTSGTSVTASSNIFSIQESSGEQESGEGSQAVVTATVITYVVQPGDTLSTIAQTYGTTVNAIMALNPQITNSAVIYTGEVLRIPVNQASTSPIIPLAGASVVLTPSNGAAGSSVEVIVSGFPANTPIAIQLHTPGYTQVGTTQNTSTNANGQATVFMNIPSSVNESNETWLAQVTTTSGTSLTASSNEFVVTEAGEQVTPIVAQPGEIINYVVQPGDNLSTLAVTYDTTVNAILALNPQITNPNLIYSGQVIRIPVGTAAVPPSAIIPSTGPSAVISPNSGLPGSSVDVIVSGFPANTPIQIGLHKSGKKLLEVTQNTTTNANGSATVVMQIPTFKNITNNEIWLAQVSTTSGQSLTVNSNEFFIQTTSTVTPVIPATGPSAVITPASGPQGTYIQVIVTGFPANTPIKLGLHKLNRKLIESHATATTDAYGAATVTMRIPTGSNVNNNRVWLAQVSTTSGPSLTVTSNQFDVTGQ